MARYAIKTFIVTALSADMDLKKMIAEYPDFPKDGVLFRDVGPVLGNPDAMQFIADEFGRRIDMTQIDILAGIESRGFILSTLLGVRYGKGTIMMRKPGKLPGDTASRSYQLEYGQSALELQKNAIAPGQRVLICDDLLATGGTAGAAVSLVEQAGGIVAGLAFVIELSGIGGSGAISKYGYEALITY